MLFPPRGGAHRSERDAFFPALAALPRSARPGFARRALGLTGGTDIARTSKRDKRRAEPAENVNARLRFLAAPTARGRPTPARSGPPSGRRASSPRWAGRLLRAQSDGCASSLAIRFFRRISGGERPFPGCFRDREIRKRCRPNTWSGSVANRRAEGRADPIL